MKIGLLGLPQAGKTTVFNALSGLQASTNLGQKTEKNLAVVKVPDPRIDELTAIYKPKKTIYATTEYIDLPGEASGKKSNSYWGTLRTVDVLVHIVRAFESDTVAHIKESVDYLRDIRDINSELIFSDLNVTENNLDKVQRKLKAGKEKDLQDKEALLLKCKEALENEIPLSTLEWSPNEREMFQSYQYLTLKPMIVMINLEEDQPAEEFVEKAQEILKEMQEVKVLSICGKLEMEIGQLDSEEQALFLEELEIEELALDRFIRESFSLLGLISFFTVGEDEVRAWPIRRNTRAVNAAGAIHSDLERGFIRAEVFHYQDLMDLDGNPGKLKEAGKMRLEGKEYIVKDADILNIRANVSGGKKK